MGLRAAKTIASGKLLTSEMVEKIPAVKKGETVSVKFNEDKLLVSVEGLSMCDGWLDDVVNVEVFGKKVEAMVVGEKEVLATGGGR